MPLRFSIRAKPAQACSDKDAPALLIERTVEVPFASGQIVIGRHPGVDIELPFPAVSGRHAHLSRDGAGYRIEDLGSVNGTLLGSRRLVPHVSEVIALGETICVADVEVKFEGEIALPGPGLETEGTETLARRLVHDIFEVAPPAECVQLVVLNGPLQGRELILGVSGRVFRIGRGENCDFILPDEDVSREHAAFERCSEGIIVRDLGSKNGIEIQDKPIEGARRLCDGDTLRIGGTMLKVVDPEDRYLRQMQEAEACSKVPIQKGESSIDQASAKRNEDVAPSRLPAIATAIAVAVILMTLGLVLALALSA